MKHRRLSLAFVVFAAVVYLTAFPLDYVPYDETNEATEQLWVRIYELQWLIPLIGVAVATQRWARWWLVPAVFALFVSIPFAAEEIELRLGLLDTSCRGGMDCIGEHPSFLSILSIPAVVIALAGVSVARLRLRRRRRVPRTATSQ